jgi:predicted secreted protein
MISVSFMSRPMARAIFLGLACGIASACAATIPIGAKNPPILTEQSSGAVLRTRVGVPVEIRLREQPGTGFSWFPTSFAANLTAMEAIRGPAIPGGSQLQRFRFVAKHVGTYRVAFSYDQPWAGGSKGARSAAFTINVR